MVIRVIPHDRTDFSSGLSSIWTDLMEKYGPAISAGGYGCPYPILKIMRFIGKNGHFTGQDFKTSGQIIFRISKGEKTNEKRANINLYGSPRSVYGYSYNKGSRKAP